MIWFAIIVNTLLIFKLIKDYHTKNVLLKVPNHKKSALIDTAVYIASALFLTNWKWIEALGLVLIALGYRWVMFDIIFNLINKWKWNHYGESSKLDRWLTSLGKWHLLPKIILIATGIILIKIA